MSQAVSGDDLKLGRLDAVLQELEQAWIDEEFAAIISINWAGEPPSPTSPGRLPARWHDPAPEDRPGPRRWPRPRRLAPDSLSRQRSPPHADR